MSLKWKLKLLNVVKEGGNKVDISEAKILVSGGRGVGAKQNFELLEDLAAENWWNSFFLQEHKLMLETCLTIDK